MSDIQDYIEYVIKKHETLTAIPPIHVYINKINNRLVLKIKVWYKSELQTPETVKLSGSTKKLIGQTKNGENAPRLEVVEVVLVQCNVVEKANGLKVSAVTPLFLNRVVLEQRWALNQESTLIRGGRGGIVWDGRFFSILFLFCFVLFFLGGI